MTTGTSSSYLLGKGPAKTDPRTLRLENYILPGFPAPPDAVDNSQRVGAWGILGNNVKGCCVLSAHGHNLMLWAAMAGQAFGISDADVLQLYDFLTHSVDSGLVILDTLKWLMANTWKAKKVLGFASVDPKNLLIMKHAIAMFGSVYRGILLPITAQRQVGTLWDFLPNTPGNTPGSWGGHATIDIAYDATNHFKTITWGLIQLVTAAFYNAYADEGWVIIPTEKIPGFDQDGYIRDLEAIGQYYGPAPAPPAPVPPTPPPPGPTPPPSPMADPLVRTEVRNVFKSGKVLTGGVGFSTAAGKRWWRFW